MKAILILATILFICQAQQQPLKVELQKDLATLVNDLKTKNFVQLKNDLKSEVEQISNEILDSQDMAPVVDLEKDVEEVVEDFKSNQVLPAVLELKQIFAEDLEKAINAISYLKEDVIKLISHQSIEKSTLAYQVIQKLNVTTSKYCCCGVVCPPNACKPGQLDICE